MRLVIERLQRANGTACDFGDLREFHSLVLLQDHDDMLIFRQRGDRVLDVAGQFAFFQIVDSI